jgi:hypothetical protein
MCIEDIRIGRRAGYAETKIVTTGALDQLCAANSKRIGLRISWSGQGQFQGAAIGFGWIPQYATIGPKQDQPSSDGGINLSPYTPEYCLTIEKDGLAVCDEWFGFDGNGGGYWWTVREVFLEDDALRQAVDPNLQGQP